MKLDYDFLNKIANKKQLLAIIRRLIYLMGREAITIGNHVILKTTVDNIKIQPTAINILDKFVISPPFFLLFYKHYKIGELNVLFCYFSSNRQLKILTSVSLDH